jgi:branched-chain amino acid transport system substrate-binding protein
MRSRPIIALLLALGACSSTQGTLPEPIRLGALYPLSGTQARYGTEELRGAQIAVELFNSRGGLRGRPVRLEVADAPDVDAAWRQAYRLARMKLPAIIGTYGSTLSLAASEVAHREGVLYWETGAVADLITARGYPEVFRAGVSGATLAGQAAGFSVDVLASLFRIAPRSLRVAVVYEDDPYGSSVGVGMRREAASRGFRLVGSFAYDPVAEQFDGIVRALSVERPDVVVAATYLHDGARLREKLLEAKLPLKALIGKCAAFYTEEMARLLGPKIDGVFVADKPKDIAPAALLPQGRALADELERRSLERFAKRPDAAAYMGFSGTWILLEQVLAHAPSLSLEDLRRAALAVDLPSGSLPNGAGALFAPPGDTMAGQNLRAFGVVWQWQHATPVIVYPPAAARGRVQLAAR